MDNNEDEEMCEELGQKLTESWDSMVKAQPASKAFLQESTKSIMAGQYQLVKFFNPKLDINRFFIEDSDGKKNNNPGNSSEKMPSVEFGGGSGGFADNSDPFENELDDALNVFKSGDENNDIIKNNENLIMFYVDLEEECFINKDGEESKDDGEQMGQKQHPILFNQYPISMNHSMMLLFAEAGLPQILSDELLVLVLQLFKLSDNPNLKLGYNSMGADCVANNLHFHLVYADSMFEVLGQKE